jgi:TonB family protein
MNLTEWEAASWAFVGMALGTILRSVVLAALGGAGIWLLRSRTAALRFTLWRWTLVGLLALPVLMRVAPPLFQTSRAVSRLETAVLPRPLAARAIAPNRAPNPPSFTNEPARRFVPWILALPLTYCLVTGALLACFAYNLRRLRGIAARSGFIPDAPLRALAHEVWLASGAFLKPRLASSAEISVPVTFEADDVWILLPLSWRAWDEAKLRAVLTHEMAHIARGDSATLRMASFATCLFWFHPLSWFLRRELAFLAEEACDEIVVASATPPEQYAHLLIDFAADMRRRQGRLIAEATGVVRGSSLQRRIERLFAARPSAQRGKRIFAIVAAAIFLPALYLTAAARFDQPPSQPKIVWPQWQKISGLSEADVAALEATLQAHPEDLDTRMELLVYFGQNGEDLPFTAQLLWLIQHHPDVSTLPMAQGMFRYQAQLSELSAEQIKAAWEEAVVKHQDSPAVLVNAASFFERSDPERALELFRKAQALDPIPNQYTSEIAVIYAAAEAQAILPEASLNNIKMDSETVARLREQLAGSGDAALLAAVGRILVQLNVPGLGGAEQTSRGLALIRQAIALDPGNAKWTALLEDALAEPQRTLAFKRLRSEPPKPGVVRIGSAIAEASLISKADPVYPPLALSARIQGTVEFTVTVGPDGTVECLELVRGHPLLVQAAKAAVLKYLYHPATQDGQGVPFVTQVLVPFRITE